MSTVPDDLSGLNDTPAPREASAWLREVCDMLAEHLHTENFRPCGHGVADGVYVALADVHSVLCPWCYGQRVQHAPAYCDKCDVRTPATRRLVTQPWHPLPVRLSIALCDACHAEEVPSDD